MTKNETKCLAFVKIHTTKVKEVVNWIFSIPSTSQDHFSTRRDELRKEREREREREKEKNEKKKREKEEAEGRVLRGGKKRGQNGDFLQNSSSRMPIKFVWK